MGQYSKNELIALAQNTAIGASIDPYIAVAQANRESRFSPAVVYGPRTGADGEMGMWQFMPATGAMYGLFRSADFYDPDRESIAWSQYMNDLLNQFNGRYDLALAGYNWGANRNALRQAAGSGQSILNYNIPSGVYGYVSEILSNAGYASDAIVVRGLNDALAGTTVDYTQKVAVDTQPQILPDNIPLPDNGDNDTMLAVFF